MSVTWLVPMISADEEFRGAPRLRGQVTLEQGHGEVVRARLLASALGVFEAFVGGQAVSDEVLSPGWSSYEWRLRYREYDVTGRVSAVAGSGQSLVLGIALGNGWYRGRLGFHGNRAIYGDELAAIAQLEVEFADGHVQVAGTDEGWRAGPSPVLENDLYDGQTIDARLRDDSWLGSGFHQSDWSGVHVVDLDTARLTPYLGPVVRRQEELAAVRIWSSPSGRTLVDFGQNIAGWVRLRAQGDPGQTITVRYAEVLEDDELGTRPLRTRQGHRPLRPQWGGRRVRADLHLPRLPLRGGRSATRERSPRRTSRRWSCTRTCAVPGSSAARTRCSTSCTTTSSGRCAATSSTCRPTARSVTSGSVGPATSPCSPRQPPTCSRWGRSSTTGSPTSPSSRPTWAAWCRSSSRTTSSTTRPTPIRSARSRPLSGRTPQSGSPGRCGRPMATRRPSAGTTRRWRRTCGTYRSCSRTMACGTRVSSSATGSTPLHHPRTPCRPRPTPAS